MGREFCVPAQSLIWVKLLTLVVLECDDLGSGAGEIGRAHRIVMPKVVAFFENGGCLA